MANKVDYKSFVSNITKDIDNIEKETLKEACTHLRKKMRDKVNKKGRSLPGMPPGRDTGNLRKGIKYNITKSIIGMTGFVGVGSPAQHAHLLEFGTKIRHTTKGVNKGQVLPRPFVRPTFEEEAEAVNRIMRGQISKL